MLEVVGDPNKDWSDAWKGSPEAKNIYTELDKIHRERAEIPESDDDPDAHKEFAMPFMAQLREVAIRVLQQYWRMPSYIMAKFGLGIAAGLFIGFSFFNADNSQQGMQNVLYSL